MAIGDISAVINSLEFDTGFASNPHVIHISGNIFAIAYTGPSNDGWVATFTVDKTGIIGTESIDSLEFDSVDCRYPRIIHVAGTTYTIAYQNTFNNKLKIVTLDIDSTGNIGATIIDSFLSTDDNGFMPKILHIFGEIFAISYQDQVSNGKVITVAIDNAGNIGAAEIDTLEFEAGGIEEHDFIHVSGTVYAIVATGPAGDGWLYTFTISPSGIISDTVTDTLEFDTADCQSPELINIVSNIYGIAYEGVDGDGFVKTVKIETDGVITGVVDTLEFDTENGSSPSIVSVSEGLYAIAYTGASGDGFLVTFIIGSNGTIGSVLGTLEFDTVTTEYPNLIVVPNSNVLAVAYGENAGWGSDGWLKTTSVRVPGAYRTGPGAPGAGGTPGTPSRYIRVWGNPSVDQLIYQHAERIYK